jgi:hypothetical protein
MITLFIVAMLLATSAFIFAICFNKAVDTIKEIGDVEEMRKETASNILERIENLLYEKGDDIDVLDVKAIAVLIKLEYDI